MIKTVKQACRFNPAINDYRMSQEIENLADLINDAEDGPEAGTASRAALLVVRNRCHEHGWH
jgi:hypothetical protein